MITTETHEALSLESRFAAVGVPAAELNRYFGRLPAMLSGQEYDHLTKLVTAIEQGRAVWSDALEYKLTADQDLKATA